MKKLFTIIIAAAGLLCACLPAAAEGMTSYQLFTQWEEQGYPEDVTGVFYNSETKGLSILLTENTEARQKEISAMVTDADTVTYYAGQYSHAELETVRAAIAEQMTAEGSPIVGVGTGWGAAGGYGADGHDFRVVVQVQPERAEELAADYGKAYGEMVAVEAAAGAVTDTTEQNTMTDGIGTAEEAPKKGLSDWGIIGIAAICLGGLVFGVDRVRKGNAKKHE